MEPVHPVQMQVSEENGRHSRWKMLRYTFSLVTICKIIIFLQKACIFIYSSLFLLKCVKLCLSFIDLITTPCILSGLLIPTVFLDVLSKAFLIKMIQSMFNWYVIFSSCLTPLLICMSFRNGVHKSSCTWFLCKNNWNLLMPHTGHSVLRK